MKALAAALTLAALGSPAWAQTAPKTLTPATLAPVFEGTVVSTYPDGRTAKAWLDPDGTYRGQGRSGKPSAGRWTLKGQRVCFRQSRPVPVPMSYCTAAPAAGGTSWTGKAVTGEPVRITVVPGR